MKKKLKKEGIFQGMQDKRYYQKPSEKRREAKKRGRVAMKKAQKLRMMML